MFEFCFVSKSRKNCGFFCAYMLCICSNKGEKSRYIYIFSFVRIFCRAWGAEKTASRHEANENILYHAEFVFFFIHNFFFDIILCVKLQNKPIE